MPVAAIETVTDTWVPTLGQVDEIIGKLMRVFAKVNSYDRESDAKGRDEIAQLNTQQQLYAAILKTFGKFLRPGHKSVTIEIHIDHYAPAPSLTEKQRRSIALVKKWMSEDRDEQTEAMRRFMEAIDEDREGFRTLYKNK